MLSLQSSFSITELDNNTAQNYSMSYLQSKGHDGMGKKKRPASTAQLVSLLLTFQDCNLQKRQGQQCRFAKSASLYWAQDQFC